MHDMAKVFFLRKLGFFLDVFFNFVDKVSGWLLGQPYGVSFCVCLSLTVLSKSFYSHKTLKFQS